MHLWNPAARPLLTQENTPKPTPGAGEVLVRVFAAGVTPTELAWYPTSHNASGEPRSGAIPAHEFSGEIAGTGTGVAGFPMGQAVYGMNDWFQDGALAEYCITRPEWIAPKPKRLTHAEAAAVPIGALTAWQGLFNRARLEPGERVLIHGGAGAVGVFAIQLAHARGAHVTTTVSAADLDFVRQLGADEGIDYKATPFESVAREMDVVFDAVGGDTLRRSWSVLKPTGRLVTIAAESESAHDTRIKKVFFIVEPSREQLLQIGRRLDAGELQVFVDRLLPLTQASQAYPGCVNGKVEKRGRGKSVVEILASPAVH